MVYEKTIKNINFFKGTDKNPTPLFGKNWHKSNRVIHIQTYKARVVVLVVFIAKLCRFVPTWISAIFVKPSHTVEKANFSYAGTAIADYS